MGSVGLIVHSSVSLVPNVDALSFMLGWGWYGFHKKRTGTCYAELESWHLVGSVGHVVHSGAFGA
jgi:hypothetical protein